jgi:CRISPR-associated protein Csd1
LSWIQMLCDTYENCSSQVGVWEKENSPFLLPVAHSTQNAQIEVVIDAQGNFRSADLVDKKDASTIIPVTEDSATRSSGIAPHPLCDKLQYVAGDYSLYVEKKNVEEYYKQYIAQLEAWCASPYVHRKVNTLLTYLKKKTLISDLVKHQILVCDDQGQLSKEIKLGQIAQEDVFIRFRVEVPGIQETALWKDTEIYGSFVDYYLSMQKDQDLCYVKGEIIRCSEKHPAKLRNTGDKAKLISANDEVGFTYRGRFSDKKQSVQIGYETSQKAHNALRWLIEKQGYPNGDQVVVAWGTRDQKLPELFKDTYEMLPGQELHMDEDMTSSSFAERLNRAMAGYGCDLDTKDQIVIMALDAATIGRLSITYYHEMNGSYFQQKIISWHSTCVWRQSKRISDGEDEKGKAKTKLVRFVGAPAPIDIVYAAYGRRVNDRLKQATIERLLPCITNKTAIPYDLVHSVINRVSNPLSMEEEEWNTALGVACALVNKYSYDKDGRVWTMSLNEKETDRSYLFGRLLAIAEQIENKVLWANGEKRETNAERLMNQFRMHPYRTWEILRGKLRPYQARLVDSKKYLEDLMSQVAAMIPIEEFTKPEKLKGSYLLGYDCQKTAFREAAIQRKEERNKASNNKEVQQHE